MSLIADCSTQRNKFLWQKEKQRIFFCLLLNCRCYDYIYDVMFTHWCARAPAHLWFVKALLSSCREKLCHVTSSWGDNRGMDVLCLIRLSFVCFYFAVCRRLFVSISILLIVSCVYYYLFLYLSVYLDYIWIAFGAKV